MSFKEVTNYDEWEKYMYDMPTVVSKRPVDQSRWSTTYEKVVKDEKTGLYYMLIWETGSTEIQDMPWEDEYHAVKVVVPVEKTITVYE